MSGAPNTTLPYKVSKNVFPKKPDIMAFGILVEARPRLSLTIAQKKDLVGSAFFILDLHVNIFSLPFPESGPKTVNCHLDTLDADISAVIDGIEIDMSKNAISLLSRFVKHLGIIAFTLN